MLLLKLDCSAGILLPMFLHHHYTESELSSSVSIHFESNKTAITTNALNYRNRVEADLV